MFYILQVILVYGVIDESTCNFSQVLKHQFSIRPKFEYKGKLMV